MLEGRHYEDNNFSAIPDYSIRLCRVCRCKGNKVIMFIMEKLKENMENLLIV